MPPQEQDQLYNSYSRLLYRITGNEASDDISDMLASDSSATNAQQVSVSGSDITSGVDTSTSVQASGSMQGGKKTFDNSVSGFILGTDPIDGKAKFYLGSSTKYINWDGSNLNVVGGVSISQLDIPDTVTANSFHVDSMGNAWWGATSLGASVASITKAGAATFKSISRLDVPDTVTASSFHVDSSGNAWWGATTLGTAIASVTAAGVATFTSVSVNTSILTVQPVGGGGPAIRDATTVRTVSSSTPAKVKTLTCNVAGIYTFNVDLKDGNGLFIASAQLVKNGVQVASVSRTASSSSYARLSFGDFACVVNDVFDLYLSNSGNGGGGDATSTDSYQVQGQNGFGCIIGGSSYGFIPTLTTGSFPSVSASNWTITLD